MDTRKKRSLLVEKLSRLHASMASFNKSDESYDQCLKRLTVFAENSDCLSKINGFCGKERLSQQNQTFLANKGSFP